MNDDADARRRPRWRSLLYLFGAIVLGAFLLIQLVPYGWKHSNPPVVQDAPWPSAVAASIARTSCYDCHSNETNWRLYSYVAPMSWLVRKDVDDGRAKLNFSDWGQHGNDAHDAGDAVANGSMPPRQYTLIHPSARLTAAEKQVLIDAFNQMDGGN